MEATAKPTDFTVTVKLNAAEVDDLVNDRQMLATLAMSYRDYQGIDRACPRLARLLDIIAESAHSLTSTVTEGKR